MATNSSQRSYRAAGAAAGLTMSAFMSTQALTKFSRSVGVRNLAFLRTPITSLLRGEVGGSTPGVIAASRIWGFRDSIDDHTSHCDTAYTRASSVFQIPGGGTIRPLRNLSPPVASSGRRGPLYGPSAVFRGLTRDLDANQLKDRPLLGTPSGPAVLAPLRWSPARAWLRRLEPCCAVGTTRGGCACRRTASRGSLAPPE